jgi:hypothetical protein
LIPLSPAILSETLFKVFSEWITGDRISVGAPFFNKVNIPVAADLVFDGRGPAAGVGKDFYRELEKKFRRAAGKLERPETIYDNLRGLRFE